MVGLVFRKPAVVVFFPRVSFSRTPCIFSFRRQRSAMFSLAVPGTRLTVPGTRLTVRLRKRQAAVAAARKPRLPAGGTAGRSGVGPHRNIDALVKQNYWLQIIQPKIPASHVLFPVSNINVCLICSNLKCLCSKYYPRSHRYCCRIASYQVRL